MRDWNELKQWAEGLQHCPEHYDMPAEVVHLVMADLLALMAENEALRDISKSKRWEGWATQRSNRLPKLFGARDIAEMNWYPEDGEDLIRVIEIERVSSAPK